MNIFSPFVAAWMALLSFFGFSHKPQMPTQITPPAQVQQLAPASTSVSSGTTTSTATTQTNPQTSEPTVTATVSELPATGSPWQTSLPLGDGKYVTSGPKQGYIYVCNVVQGGEGAQGTPTWISGSTWYPEQKVAVEGSVSWPNASYSMTVSGSTRTIKSNGLPTDHATGIFPIESSDPAYQFDRNPNTIEAQNYSFSLPADPTMLAAPQCIYGEVGIMNDGVPLFDGFDAEYRDAVAHETQDAWDGHPDQGGVYHDHGFEDAVMQDTPVSTVVGFAFDGFPITGGKLPDGTYLTTSQLDECHGITSAITLDGKTVTMYHYVLTQDFPYSVSCFRGKSYEPKPGGGPSSTNGVSSATGSQSQNGSGAGSNGTPPTPPQAAITACSDKTSGESCSFSGQNNGGTISGTCQEPPNQSSLVCVPN